MKKIAILDYGLGNILSLKNSLNYLGFDNFLLSTNPKKAFDCLIIPGVGSFSHAMKLIKKDKLDLINKTKEREILIIGICLGMQILTSKGFEGGKTKGLSLISGLTSKLNRKENNKLPRVGWKKTFFKNNDCFFSEFNNEKFYYIHSFKTEIKKKTDIIGHSFYGNKKIISAINKKNIFGFQFHPEKSGEVGLELIKRLLQKY